jgi:eukaryotic translation initiation factor 2C
MSDHKVTLEGQAKQVALQMITNLAVMMHERLLAFKEKNNALPQRILVYRDGVSEVTPLCTCHTCTYILLVPQGQFPIVVGEELPAIKSAFRKLDTPRAPYTPKLTIVICGKRHHTRFYPNEAAHADRDGNPRPGTVVDRGVTAVYDFDFFLQGPSLLRHIVYI